MLELKLNEIKQELFSSQQEAIKVQRCRVRPYKFHISNLHGIAGHLTTYYGVLQHKKEKKKKRKKCRHKMSEKNRFNL